MACSQNKIQIASLQLGNGWSGRVVLSDLSSGVEFSAADWIKCLSQPHLLFEDVSKTIKVEGRNRVAIKNLTIAGTNLKAVIKRSWPEDGFSQFFRSFRSGRAVRNFDTALTLHRLGIPAVAPLAVMQEKKGPLTRQSIYITRYLEESYDLRDFCRQYISERRLSLRKHLSNQLASILATLHKNGLWHRDSKANNFLVTPQGGDKYKVLLTDMDGIKPYRLRREACRLRSLWQLAASLMSIPAVSRTDYLRFFLDYCNLTDIAPSQRREIYRQLAEMAKAKYRRLTRKNILIIKPSSLGDVVMALPALSALRRSFPQAKISWFIRPEFAPLIKNHPDLNEVILFERKFLGRALSNPRAFGALVALIWRINRCKFDIVIDLQGLFRTAAFAWLSGCKKRFGMANAGEFAHLFYTNKIKQDSVCIHLVDYYLEIVRQAGAAKIDVQFLLPVDSVAADSVNRLLKAKDIKPDNYAVFVPTSAHEDKCWPVERFAALADKITKQFHLSIIATGSASEKPIVERLKNKANVPIANFAGVTSIGELVTLLKGARLVVSNDTGPGHIAAALGVPVVLIFGRSNPARVAPYGRPDCAAAIEPNGRGFEADSTDPKHDIKAITVDEVYQKVCEQL
ncbi:MAG: glycosyltransferase family 9 protein [Phycisphaerae bacterium]|nr:glycosyltransferase family 9 protein [Phycisphaerae bacterium]